MSYLRVGGHILNLMVDVPSELVKVIQAVIILLITAEAFLGAVEVPNYPEGGFPFTWGSGGEVKG